MLFLNARPAYVIEYTTISCFFKIQKSFLKRRKLNWEIPRFKRCLHHRNKSRLGQPFCFPRSRICYSGFSRSEKDIEWYWKSFEKESWRWIVFSLSKKYLSFVKFLCILVWQCIYFFISYRAGHNRFTVSWTIFHSSRHCPNNLVGQDDFSRTSGPLFYSKHTPLSLQLPSKAGNQKKRPESSSTSLVHSTINHHSPLRTC